MNNARALAPVLLTRLKTQAFRDPGQPVTRRPTHDGGRRVHMRDGAELPDARIGRVINRKGALTYRLQLLEFGYAGL